MTGNAADADDLVQETFVRAIEKPPTHTDQPMRPWLVRVALNLSRDALRKRKRAGYAGPWLPSPVQTDEESPASYEPPAPDNDSPAARYDLKESISFAFLLALEALTPSQRAVLLLRDVFDYSTEETAIALDLSEANTKVLLLRARRKMKEYDHHRIDLTVERSEATRRALEQFLLYLEARDSDGIEKLLAEDVISISDGGGEVAAARQIIRGRDRVLRLILGLASKVLNRPQFDFQFINGLPALLVSDLRTSATVANRYTIQIELDDDCKIRALYAVLSPTKLSAMKFQPDT